MRWKGTSFLSIPSNSLRHIIEFIAISLISFGCKPPVAQNSSSEVEAIPSLSPSDQRAVASGLASCGSGAVSGLLATPQTVWWLVSNSLIQVGGLEHCLYAWTGLPGNQAAYSHCTQAVHQGEEIKREAQEIGRSLGRISEFLAQFSTWWMHSSTLNERIEIGCSVIIPTLVSLGTAKLGQLAKEANTLSYILKNNPKDFANIVLLTGKNANSKYLLLRTMMATNRKTQLMQSAARIAPAVAVLGPIDELSGPLGDKAAIVLEGAKAAHEAKLFPNLTFDEIYALRAYTSDAFEIINTEMRSGGSRVKSSIEAIRRALSKLPAEELSALDKQYAKLLKRPVLLSRGFRTRRFFETWKAGQILDEKGFTSTMRSLDNTFAFRDSEVKEVMLIVNNKTGKFIPKELSHMAGGEREILFPPTRFRFLESQTIQAKSVKLIVGFFEEL